MSEEVLTFLRSSASTALAVFPVDICSNDFRYLIQSMLFSRKFYDANFDRKKEHNNKLHEKIVDTIRHGYQQLIDGEENSFKVNKICRVLNDFDDKKEEKVLLKEICTYAT